MLDTVPVLGHQSRCEEGHLQITHEGHCLRLQDIERFIPASIKTRRGHSQDPPVGYDILFRSRPLHPLTNGPLLSRRYQTPCRRRYRYRSQVR